jgi:two-component system cell cycle response regulator DivK
MMPEMKSILYIEDNFENRTLVRRLLLSLGYNVLEAGNAAQALDVLANNHPDLILMDINMPDVDGYTLTQQIKAMPEFKKVPVIAITANVMRGDREKSLEAGCDGYIEKPIDVDRFLDQIADLI